MMRKAGILDTLKKVKEGAAETFGEGREDRRIAFKRAREDDDQAPEAARIESMAGQHRGFQMLKQLFNRGETQRKVYDEMGMGLSDDRAKAVGQVLGALGADITQDASREVWWLLNAPQAVGNVLQEWAVKSANPDIFNKLDEVITSSGAPLTITDEAGRAAAVDMGVMSPGGRLKKGYSMHDEDGEKIVKKRRYEPGFADALGIPTGLAINSGIGLMNPFGGQEGYKAAIESEEDPSKTDNVLAEVAAKYILGRTGNLLAWEDFKKVRPDVSKDEYMRYKAFKFDNEGDLNPFDDGQAVVPTGVLKYTNEGIHGPEVQFLGRSLPVATAILPTVAAIACTALGARRGARTGHAIRGGMIGGMGALAAGSLTGNLIEGERRRRNQEENESGYN